MIKAKSITSAFLGYWQPVVALLGYFALCFMLFFYKLGSITPGYSSAELALRESSNSLHAIFSNPLFAPYKLLQFTLIKLSVPDEFIIRGAGVIFAVLIGLAFYYVLKRWFTGRISVIGTILLITSGWFLGTARHGSDILYFLPVVLLAYGTWQLDTKRYALALVSGLVLTLAVLYVPGGVWFLLSALIWQRKALLKLAKDAPKTAVIAGFLLLAGMVPMLTALAKDSSMVGSFLGIQFETLRSTSNIFGNFKNLLDALIFHGPSNPRYGIKGIAILDVFILVMAFLGIYAAAYRRQLDRSKALTGYLALGSLLIIIGGIVPIIIILPAIYILSVFGIALMLQQWFTVFPRNPLARAIGFTLIMTAVFISVYYQLNTYFIAWPHTAKVKVTYNLKP